MSLRQEARAAPVGTALQKGSRLEGRRIQRAGFLIVLAGSVLIILATDGALAGVVLGGGEDDSLSGSGRGETLVGFGAGDEVRGLGGDDTLSGGGGVDELYGGPGHDALLAGAGDDFVEARDGERDYVWCGPGADAASVDPIDRVAATCETLYMG